MTRSNPPMAAMTAWMAYAQSFARMSLAANEVILRRTQRMALGAMTTPEAIGMVLEKATAFASASEKAAVAAARGGDVVKIAHAALSPYGARTRANVRRLRK